MMEASLSLNPVPVPAKTWSYAECARLKTVVLSRFCDADEKPNLVSFPSMAVIGVFGAGRPGDERSLAPLFWSTILAVERIFWESVGDLEASNLLLVRYNDAPGVAGVISDGSSPLGAKYDVRIWAALK